MAVIKKHSPALELPLVIMARKVLRNKENSRQDCTGLKKKSQLSRKERSWELRVMGILLLRKETWTCLHSDAVWGGEEITGIWGSGGVNTV